MLVFFIGLRNVASGACCPQPSRFPRVLVLISFSLPPRYFCVCVQGALKLKEMAYIHAEGYSGGALKHGPFALIEGPEGDNGATPIILIILDDEHAHQVRGTSTSKVRNSSL